MCLIFRGMKLCFYLLFTFSFAVTRTNMVMVHASWTDSSEFSIKILRYKICGEAKEA
jgi:hypothetical protein